MPDDQAIHQTSELARLLEGRIDQHQTAPLLGRQERAECQPPIQSGDACLDVAGELGRQGFGVVGMELQRAEPVLRAEQCPRHEWRAGIRGEAIRIQLAYHVEVRVGRRRQALGQHPRNALAPLRRALRFRPGQVVAADSGVGVDHPEGCVLALEVGDQQRKDDVLDDIDEAAGMERMAVVHG